MDYEQAKGIMEQHRVAVEGSYGAVKAVASPIQKRLENKTVLRYVDAKVAPEHEVTYELVIFGNPIIVFYPGAFEINDYGWYSRTTHLRLNQYMPAGHSIHSMRLPQLQRIKHISFIKAPSGTYPYNMPMLLPYVGLHQPGKGSY
jgi:hypothetical protein